MFIFFSHIAFHHFNFLRASCLIFYERQNLWDDKMNLNEKLKFGFGRVENIVGKGENAGYKHFLHFPQCFQITPVSGSLKVWIVW